MPSASGLSFPRSVVSQGDEESAGLPADSSGTRLVDVPRNDRAKRTFAVHSLA